MKLNLPRSAVFWSVSLGHMVNDMFMSMGPVLLTFISVYMFPISGAQIGLAVGIAQLTGALSQPFFGWFADRTGGRWLGAAGVAWTGSMLMVSLLLAHQTRQFWLMAIPFVIMALGSAAFHPVGSKYAVEVDKTQAGRNSSIFFLLGQTGLAIGPALAGVLLTLTASHTGDIFGRVLGPTFGGNLIESGSIVPIFLVGLVILPIFLYMAASIPDRKAYDGARAKVVKTVSRVKKSAAIKSVILLGALIAIRGLGQPGSVAFIPLLFQQKGWTAAEYGLITSSFWLASGLAGVYFGTLADRYPRRYVVAVSLFLSAPAFFLLPTINGPMAFIVAIAAGGLSGGSHSLLVVLTQELLPVGKAMASGISLGFIFGTGAVGSLLMGNMADTVGLETAFHVVALATVVASLLSLALPARAEEEPTVDVEVLQPAPVR